MVKAGGKHNKIRNREQTYIVKALGDLRYDEIN
jgi:hypothetical protein